LSFQGVRFVARETSSNDIEMVKKAGFHWDGSIRAYWTSIAYLAASFKQYADASAQVRIGYDDSQIALSHALGSTLRIPVPDGLCYLPFQTVAAEYAIQRKDTLIADPPGAGKSIEAISIINFLPEIKKILIICPASLRINWSRELMRWLTKELTGGFALGGQFPDTNIIITNYEQVKAFRKRIDKEKWDLVIFDESHMCKNPKSQRTRASLGWVSETGKTHIPPIDAGMRLFLTGTPILNRPVELWPMLRIADPDGLGANQLQFEKHYCAAWDAPWGYDATGVSKRHLEDLQKRLRSKLMIRRSKELILPQLPPKRRQIITLPAEAARQAIQAELDYYERNQTVVEEATKNAAAEIDYQQAADQLTEGKAAQLWEMSRLRHATGQAKIPYIIEYLEQALAEREKVVVFAHHRDIIDAIVKHFKKKAVSHHGGMTNDEKQKSIDRFQGDKSVNIFVGSITMAVGYTLTAASLVVIAELDWRSSVVLQAEDRLHRIGQMNPVQVSHLIFDNSLDSRIVFRVIEKEEIAEKALGS
jgi:SWI/SNF-related matrix-associated actin-dependent regulator 1 of chromatin subfamily A